VATQRWIREQVRIPQADSVVYQLQCHCQLCRTHNNQRIYVWELVENIILSRVAPLFIALEFINYFIFVIQADHHRRPFEVLGGGRPPV